MQQTLVDEQIRMLSRQLKVPTFNQYREAARQAGSSADIGEILLRLMQNEYDQRQENQNRRRLKQAGFPYTKTVEELDLSRYTGQLSEVFVNELSSCAFIKDHRNIIMLGNPGRGKTHLAIGMGLKACAQGMTVLFKNAASLSTELREARDNYSLGKLEKKLQRTDLLILDELGYVSFDRYQSELLFKVIADRSERGSIIVTTNLPFSEWPSLFENTAMVAAMVDRLTFKSHVLDMNGESYRLRQTKEQKK